MENAERISRVAAALEREPDVAFAYAFGSRVSGGDRPGSDLDVAVHLEGDPSPELRHTRTLDLMMSLAAAAGCEVDVVVLNGAPLPLAGRVLTEGRVIASRDDVARVRYEIATRREFFDFQYHAQRVTRALLERIAAGGS